MDSKLRTSSEQAQREMDRLKQEKIKKEDEARKANELAQQREAELKKE